MELEEFKIDIPTWIDGKWVSDTHFSSISAFREFVVGLFKEPGMYEFDETSKEFNATARRYKMDKSYCSAPSGTKDFIDYWDSEKARCVNGAIYKHGDKIWYLPREYYMWLNFLLINDKIKKRADFALVWDVQYHIALYELLAELFGKHVAIVKKRQIASSYYHAAKLINRLWFDEGAVLRIGGSQKSYVQKTWTFLDDYRDFLNEHTAWYRPMNPGEVLNWIQQVEVDIGGRKVKKGLKSSLTGTSFEKDPTKGVGGLTTVFFHEEAGIAPKMNKTYIFMKSAMEAGDLQTGLFIAAGSVGELKQAEPLRQMVFYPEKYDILAVESTWFDEKRTSRKMGLFIPEQWCMPPYIDEFGNSEVEKAMEALNIKFEKWKQEKDPKDYQLEISQHPRYLAEAFAHREESVFMTHLIKQQQDRIGNNDYPSYIVDLEENTEGNIVSVSSRAIPISDFPIKKNEKFKEGAIQVWEKPEENDGTLYVASIDPVAVGKTSESVSLCSIVIYKLPRRIVRTGLNGNIESFRDGDKVVCTWCGRFDNLTLTHRRLEFIIRWYNARAIVENNVSLFIQYMTHRKLTHLLVEEYEMGFNKSGSTPSTSFAKVYGWRNVGSRFENDILPNLVAFTEEVIDQEIDENGVIKKQEYGISRIPDPMVCIEMLEYRKELNVDRLISFGALATYVAILKTHRSEPIVEDSRTPVLEKNKNLYKLNNRSFRNIGNLSSTQTKKIRNPFRSIR